MSERRFILMHKTDPRWERGETPSPELVERVGALIAELAGADRLRAGEGLRASSLGVRVRHAGGTTTVTPGPLVGENELPAGFTLLRAASLEEATAWAKGQAGTLGEAEIDVRPVTEAWDIGMAPRPASLPTQRFMALRKATPATEAGASSADTLPAADARVQVLGSVDLKPSRRGRRYKNTREGTAVTDGPFTESKELIAGYVILAAGSLDEVDPWARRYLECVETPEVDVREVED